MNKLFKRCVNSMNYFLLKETFADERIMSEHVLWELGDFLDLLCEYWTPEIEEIIEVEMRDGDYLYGLSIDDVKDRFKNTITRIMEGEYEEVYEIIDKYIEIADRIIKEYNSNEKTIKCPFCYAVLNGKDTIFRKKILNDTDYYGITNGDIVEMDDNRSSLPEYGPLTCANCEEEIQEYLEDNL